MNNQKNQVVERKQTFSTSINGAAFQKSINQTLGDKETAKRFTAAITSAVAQNRQLQQCSPASIVAGALVAETLNLAHSTTMGHYYLVPYNTKNGTQAQFQMGYKGYIQLAIRSGQYLNIDVVAIKEGELVEYNPLGDMKFDFIKDPLKRAKAKTIGYYAFFKLVNGFEKSIYWSKEQMVEHATQYSQAYRGKTKDSFWHKDFDAMASKTMLRQLLSKWGILSAEIQTAYQADMGVVKDDGTIDYIDNESEVLGSDLDVETQVDPFDNETGEVFEADINELKKLDKSKEERKKIFESGEDLQEAFKKSQDNKNKVNINDL